MDWPLKFGIFLAPFHPVGQNPTLALERDLDLLEHLDSLGFDEAWIGEHHSAGYEIIASPEVFIAAAAQRTKHLRLGTGVSSLPYHQPLMLADRMVLLDHLTRGRVMFGVGPGALPSDAFMMGIDVARQRDMMEESFEAILELLAGEKPVNRTTDWFTLQGRPPPAPPLLRPVLRDRGRRAGVAVGSAPGRPLRRVAAVDRCHQRGRLRRARLALDRHGGARRRVRHHRRPPQVAARSARSTSPTPRSRPTRTWRSGCRSGPTTSSASPPSRSARPPTTRPSWPTP